MIVIDASVWVSVLLDTDLFHAESYAWLQEYMNLGGEIAAPSLLLPEVAASLTRRTRSAVSGRATIQYLTNLRGLRIIPLDQQLAWVAAEMAADYQLRGADAVYVALAHSLSIPLVTWDQEQIKRVQNVIKSGIPGTNFGSNGQ